VLGVGARGHGKPPPGEQGSGEPDPGARGPGKRRFSTQGRSAPPPGGNGPRDNAPGENAQGLTDQGERSHRDLWAAIDAMAARRGLSPSALARAAGLDPTSFNPAKRHAAHGRPRWPGTEALMRALAAADFTLADFARLLHDTPAETGVGGHPLKLIDLSRLDDGNTLSEDGLPSGPDWESWHAAPPHLGPRAFAVRLDTAALMPLLRPGSVLLLAPDATTRPGDRVLLPGPDGVTAAILRARTAQGCVIAPFTGSGPEQPIPAPVRWLHRIAMTSL